VDEEDFQGGGEAVKEDAGGGFWHGRILAGIQNSEFRIQNRMRRRYRSDFGAGLYG
jgi:hypothetical protein